MAGLWAEHVDAAFLFLAVATQWRVSEGQVIGLDYTAVAAGLAAEGMTPGPEQWRALRQIEYGALDALAEATRARSAGR